MACDCAEMVIEGIMGLGTVAVQEAGIPLDQARAKTIIARRDICRECPDATRDESRIHLPTKGLTNASRCKLCKCFLMAKTRLASKACDAGKWGAEQPKSATAVRIGATAPAPQ